MIRRTSPILLLLLACLSCKGDEDTGPGDQCPAYCDKLSACDDPEAATCAASCADGGETYAYIGPRCRAIYDEFNACRADMACGAQDDPQCYDVLERAYDTDACTTDLCDRHADRVVECGLVAPEYRQNHAIECSFGIAGAVERGPDCVAKTEALYECILARSCEQIDSADGCAAEETTQNVACGT